MSNPLTTDPFSLVESAIMAALTGYAPLAALIRIDNRIGFTNGKEDPGKENPSSNDFPELIVSAAGGTFGAAGTTSNSEAIIQRYTIGVTTDDQRTNAPTGGVNAIKFAVFRAAARITRSIESQNPVDPSMILGLRFVRGCRLVDFADQIGADPMPQLPGQPLRVVDGWTCIMQLDVHMVFDLEAATT